MRRFLRSSFTNTNSNVISKNSFSSTRSKSSEILTCTSKSTKINLSKTDFVLEKTPVVNWKNYIEETRAMRLFTEEKKRFKVPVLGRSQEELDLTITKDDSVHVLTQNPFGVHTFTNVCNNKMYEQSQQSFTNLHSLVPFGTPVPWLGTLPNNDLLVFAPEMGCFVRLLLQDDSGSIHFVNEEEQKSRNQRYQYGFSYFGRSSSAEGKTPSEWGIASEMLTSHGKVLVWRKYSRMFTMFDFGDGESSGERTDYQLDMMGNGSGSKDEVLREGEGEEGIDHIACASHDVWTISTKLGRLMVLRLGETKKDGIRLYNINFENDKEYTPSSTSPLSWNGQYTLSKINPWKPPTHLSIDETARYGGIKPTDTYYTTMVGQPKEVGHYTTLYASKRGGLEMDEEEIGGEQKKGEFHKLIDRKRAVTAEDYGACNNNARNQNLEYGHRFKTGSIRLNTTDQMVNVLHYRSSDYYDNQDVKKEEDAKEEEDTTLVPVIEFVDANDDVVRIIEAHLPPDALVAGEKVSQSEYRRTMQERRSPPIISLDEMTHTGEIVTLQSGGWVRVWETDEERLKDDLAVWKDMHGTAGKASKYGSLEITGTRRDRFLSPGGERTTAPDLEMPKHGKETDGKQHVGGNTWAGGTGGSNTAGLGGRGGPYRLDGGHEVHQVSEELKNEVSEEAKLKAREMADKAFQQRLNDIELGEAENDAYESYFSRVKPQVAQLQNVLENVRARAKERTWLKNTTFGELDDSKIVDGAAGERNVYKRRGSEESTPGTPQKKPKQLRFVFDVSGSMYRFNGQDGRLDRLLETAVMVMSALDGLGNRFQYSIVGHSGDGPNIPFVNLNDPPKDRGEQLRILQRMVAHTQFCMSGDSTLEATEHAIEEVSQSCDNSDESFVFVVSDANLRRYGISPHDLGTILSSNSNVNACAIFIASLADEAARIEAALPAGTGHICFDTSDLPQLFRNLFAASFAEEL
jgi:hypothetical protein